MSSRVVAWSSAQPRWLWALWIGGPLVVGLLATLATELVLQVAIVAGLGLAGYALSGRIGGADARMVRRVLLFAFGIRVVAVYALHHLFFLRDPTLLASDDLIYDRDAIAIAELWRDVPGTPVGAWPGYEHVVALLYSFFPGVLIVSRLVNAFMGAMAAALVAAAGRNLFGRRAGLAAGLITAVFPSFLVWSSLNLKEAMAIMAIALIAYETSRLKRAGPGVLPGLFLGMVLLSVARPWALFVGAAGYGLALLWVLPWGRIRALLVMAGVAFGIFILVGAGAGESEISAFGEQGVVEVRVATTQGGSALPGGAEGSSIPVVASQVLLGPFPWTAQGVRQLLALPEVILWYLLLLPLARGIRRGLRTAMARALPLLGFASSIVVAIVLLEGNLGLAFRHRLQAFVVLFVFVGAGWWRSASEPATRARTRSTPTDLVRSAG